MAEEQEDYSQSGVVTQSRVSQRLPPPCLDLIPHRGGQVERDEQPHLAATWVGPSVAARHLRRGESRLLETFSQV
jgi:hypothetical protein